MLSGFIGAAVALGLIIGFGWLRQEIAARLPNRATRTLSNFAVKNLWAGGDVDSFWVPEFKVQFSQNWEVGHQLDVIAMGSMSLYSEWSEDADKSARIYLQFFPEDDAYTGTDQIGWATISDHEKYGKYVEVRLFMQGSLIATILNELRLSTAQFIRVGGFENEKGKLVITSLTLSPK